MPPLPAVGAAWRTRGSVSVRRHSVFVHANECQRYSATNEYPADFRDGRVFRAYDSNYNIIDAEIVDGSQPEAVIESLFQNPDTEFVDARSITRGCFTFRVQRA